MFGESVYAFSSTQTGTYYNQLDMSFNTGDIVNFDLSDPSNTGKSLIFGTEIDNSGTQISSSYVTVDGNITKLDLTGYSGNGVYYFEDTEANMGYSTYIGTVYDALYTVTVSGSPSVFYLDGSANPTITFAADGKYVFDQSDSSNTGHQIVFGTVPDDTDNILGTVDGVTIVGTPGQPGAYTQFTVNDDSLDIYYFSYNTPYICTMEQ